MHRILIACTLLVLASCAQQENPKKDPVTDNNTKKESPMAEGTKIATFGNGCFWCTEAVFERLEGVSRVESGYSGGHVDNPTYEEVCGKKTGHAEVIQMAYDPSKITFAELLEVFWKTHDPTTKDRQGNDVGPQYRSVVFYHDDEQKKLAEEYRKKLDDSGAFNDPIVTEIQPFKKFWSAEKEHQDYFERIGTKNPYCRVVIVPKIEKFMKVFKDKLKKEASEPK